MCIEIHSMTSRTGLVAFLAQTEQEKLFGKELLEAIFEGYTHSADMESALSVKSTDYIFLVEQDGSLVAAAHVRECKGDSVLIRHMGVKEGYRGCGIGSYMLNFACQWCGERYYKEAYLFAKCGTEQFYVKHQFVYFDPFHVRVL